MSKFFKHFVFGLMGVVLAFGVTGLAGAALIPITGVDADWANAVGGQNVSISNDQSPNGSFAIASWGEPTGYNSPARSSYTFLSSATPFDAISDGLAFNLGIFTHNNFPIPSGSGIDKIDLVFNLGIAGLGPYGSTFLFDHNETPNSPGNVNDIVTITNPTLNANFSYLGHDYYFNLLGFSQDGGTTIKTIFSTIENQANLASLYGQITERPVTTPEPTTMLLLGLGLVGLAGVRRRMR